jgi:hypothetical protein
MCAGAPGGSSGSSGFPGQSNFGGSYGAPSYGGYGAPQYASQGYPNRFAAFGQNGNGAMMDSGMSRRSSPFSAYAAPNGGGMGGDTMSGNMPFTPDHSGMSQVMDSGMPGPAQNPSSPGNYFGATNMFDSFGSPGGSPPPGMTGIQNPGAGSGLQNGSSPGSGIAPTNLSAPQGPPQSGPGSQVAYLQSLLQGTPGGAPAPQDSSKVGDFSGSQNTWLYGPTPGSLYPQLQRPQGTPSNYGYFPGNGMWGPAPGKM